MAGLIYGGLSLTTATAGQRSGEGMTKFYAVRVGKMPGVYETWDECRAEVHKYSGAVFKSFKSLAEAEEFVSHSCCATRNEFEQSSNSPTEGRNRSDGLPLLRTRPLSRASTAGALIVGRACPEGARK